MHTTAPGRAIGAPTRSPVASSTGRSVAARTRPSPSAGGGAASGGGGACSVDPVAGEDGRIAVGRQAGQVVVGVIDKQDRPLGSDGSQADQLHGDISKPGVSHNRGGGLSSA